MWRQEERNAVWKIFYLRNQVQETERLQKTPLQQVGGSCLLLIAVCINWDISRRKCCTGCQPCEQPCGKTLSCKNHKCTSRCHTGACYPCQLQQTISCNCGLTTVSVPCGREKAVKPPRCRAMCSVPAKCGHSGPATAHSCHFGPCPRCRLPCNKPLACGHSCSAECHENVKVKVEDKTKPAGPWEVRKGPQYIMTSTPCPPCGHPVSVTCLGGHETASYPCHLAKPASCGRKCGRQLPCGNHTCSRECHKVRKKYLYL